MKPEVMLPPTLLNSDNPARLYSPSQVGGVSFFFGFPLAGAILISSNYKTLGESGLRFRTLIIGIVLTIFALIISFRLPEEFVSAVPFLSMVVMYFWAKSAQLDFYEKFIAAGGYRHSILRVCIIGILALVCVIFIAIPVFLLGDSFGWFTA